ncbi:MAG: SCO family protein [Candidatus Eisenbacteria bacterium]
MIRRTWKSRARASLRLILVPAMLELVGCGSGTASSEKAAPATASTADASLPSGLAVGESLDAFDSTLTDQFGRAVTLASYHGHPMLLAMIYTRCPSVCPLLLKSLQRIEVDLPRETRERTWFVLVTLDPDHDLPDTLRAFARSRDLNPARWRLLHGNREVTRDLAAILDVKVRDDGEGALAHSSNIYLLDGAGVIRHALVGSEADPSPLVAARMALP